MKRAWNEDDTTVTITKLWGYTLIRTTHIQKVWVSHGTDDKNWRDNAGSRILWIAGTLLLHYTPSHPRGQNLRAHTFFSKYLLWGARLGFDHGAVEVFGLLHVRVMLVGNLVELYLDYWTFEFGIDAFFRNFGINLPSKAAQHTRSENILFATMRN